MGILDRPPAHGGFQIADPRVAAPGDPYRSVLYYRMATLGPGRMPRLGSSAVDVRGLRLIRDWIARLPLDGGKEPDAARRQTLEQTREEVAAVLSLHEGGDAASALESGAIDKLLASTSGGLRLLEAIGEKRLGDQARSEAIRRAAEHPASEMRDLFERFLPEEQRTRRLGSLIRPEEILALPGDPDRGRRTFFEGAAATCRTCHRIQGQGTDLGPDLSEVGKKFTRAQILESIIEPSKTIDPKYIYYLVETRTGQFQSGLLVSDTPDGIILKSSTNQLLSLPRSGIKNLVPQKQSMMPELLLRDLTAREVADLTAFLSGLK
jgi:putative heme-binding domain-containing protein